MFSGSPGLLVHRTYHPRAGRHSDTIARKLGFKNQFSFSNPEAIIKEIQTDSSLTTQDYHQPGLRNLRHHLPAFFPNTWYAHLFYTEQFDTLDGRGKFIPVVYGK